MLMEEEEREKPSSGGLPARWATWAFSPPGPEGAMGETRGSQRPKKAKGYKSLAVESGE